MKKKQVENRRVGPDNMKRRARSLVRRLQEEYPSSRTALMYNTPLQLLISTILSALCTDARVNFVTPALFKKYKTARDFALADQSVLECEIRSTGFFRSKARSIIGASRAIVERHGGTVPNTMDELVDLPGVGRKTANCVLGGGFGIQEGIVVDTHVGRLSQRIGLTQEHDPVKIESDLMKLIPRQSWYDFSNMMIAHGRKVCTARSPNCTECKLATLCLYAQKSLNKGE